MNFKRIIIIVIFLVPLAAVFLFFGLRQINNFGDKEKEMPVKNSIKMDSLELSLEIPKTQFKQGEKVPITLSIKNVGNTSAGLFFTSGQKFDLFVKKSDGQEVWRWSRGKAFTMALEEITLKPGEQQVFPLEWAQVDLQGKQVPPGNYTLVGQSVAQGFENMVEGKIEIGSI